MAKLNKKFIGIIIGYIITILLYVGFIGLIITALFKYIFS